MALLVLVPPQVSDTNLNRLLHIARHQTYAHNNIVAAFLATGIWPFNSRRVLNKISHPMQSASTSSTVASPYLLHTIATP